jgi:hypothetical protein
MEEASERARRPDVERDEVEGWPCGGSHVIPKGPEMLPPLAGTRSLSPSVSLSLSPSLSDPLALGTLSADYARARSHYAHYTHARTHSPTRTRSFSLTLTLRFRLRLRLTLPIIGVSSLRRAREFSCGARKQCPPRAALTIYPDKLRGRRLLCVPIECRRTT